METVAANLQSLDRQEQLAWSVYLTACRGTSPASYEDREGPAWALLQATLRRIKRERERLTG
jgi:hypothetical protein